MESPAFFHNGEHQIQNRYYKYNMILQFSVRQFLISSFFIALLTMLSCSEKMHSSTVSKAVPVVSLTDMHEDILRYINEYRQRNGLNSLQMNPVISKEAQGHSMAMADKKTAFGHDGFANRVKFITEKIGFLKSSAENVAYGILTPKEVVSGWLKSPGHLRNIEGKFSLTGIGIAKDKSGTIFFTQIFASK